MTVTENELFEKAEVEQNCERKWQSIIYNLRFKLRLCTTAAITEHDAPSLNRQHVSVST